MNPDGNEQISLIRHPSKEIEPTWSPDGKYLLFFQMRDGNLDIFLPNNDDGLPRRLTKEDINNYDPNS